MTLDILDSPGSLHSLDGFYLVWIVLDSPMGNQEDKQFTRWYHEDALVGVELEVDPAKVLVGLVQILNERFLVPGLNQNVIDLGLHVVVQLTPKAGLHCALDGGAGVSEAEWHPSVSVATFGRDESRLLLILLHHQDLMVPGEGVHETQELAPSRGVDDEVDPRQRERILAAGLVQVREVDA